MSEPYYQKQGVTVYGGDCLGVLREMPDSSVDAVVTDPPYGLSEQPLKRIEAAMMAWLTGDREHVPTGAGGFMGRAWDEFVPPPAVWDECFRVLKPGGHLLAFAGSRTQDLMAMSIRLAGFEKRDSIAWLYGSGFPKSRDVSKAIDRAAGAEREVVGPRTYGEGQTVKARMNFGGVGDKKWRWGDEWLPWDSLPDAAVAFYDSTSADRMVTAAATPEAQQWAGWGTALKPAHEPIVVARKPIVGTVAANVLRHGTGALNIDASRIGTESRPVMVRTATTVSARSMSGESTGATSSGEMTTAGRWPANVVLDESQADALDQMSGELSSGKMFAGTRPKGERNTYGQDAHGGTGGASRFFYTAKASGEERITHNGVSHPTVKPLSLMRWLVRLVTPPGGTVLDPFAGSGPTVEAAILEGFGAIAVELGGPPGTDEAEYLPMIVQRINRRRDPVAFVRAAGLDLGLFEMEDPR